MRFNYLFLFCLAFASRTSAQAPVVVLRPDPSAAERRAAEVLQFYLGKICGQTVALSTSKPGRNQAPVFVGAVAAARDYGLVAPENLPEDAVFLQGKNGAFLIAGGGQSGAEFAAYSLLELLGCRKYSPRDSFIPEIKNLKLPDYQARIETPAFPYRELWYEPAFDPAWARWHKLLTNPEKQEAWGLFVHTFQHLCPEKQYFEVHPEYFAWNGAQRSPGQLCLSNDTVLQIVIESLREKIKAKPAARYWSVSQNDNFDYCKCARCAASDRRLGGPSGTLLAFVNRVAAAFPDKIISTLAYQYTRRAPEGIKPAANVSVCLCSIECNRGKSIEEGCPDFAEDVRQWSAICPRLMIWDYVVQFRSYLSPFPNWHSLSPNLRFFKKQGVEMMFEQGSGHSRSEFSDMRAYLIVKLMWNPQADADSILRDFARGYYREAAPMVLNYVDSLCRRLDQGNRWLGIYATPQPEAATFLCEPCLSAYLDQMNKAVAATPLHSPQRGRTLAATLPLLFADMELEKIRDQGGRLLPDSAGGFRYEPRFKAADLQAFADACKEFGYETLHEMNYPPAQYMADYLEDMKQYRVWHRFLQAKLRDTNGPLVTIQTDNPPSPAYEKGMLDKLLDGKRGTNDYHYNWLGFEGRDLDVTLRLSEAVSDRELPEVSTVSLRFLQDQASWVFFPEKVVIAVSADGKYFNPVRELSISLEPDGKKSLRTVEARFPAQKVRAVRVIGVNAKKCPAWHTCNGNPCWIFSDEIVVK